jgi:hypothetical protein
MGRLQRSLVLVAGFWLAQNALAEPDARGAVSLVQFQIDFQSVLPAGSVIVCRVRMEAEGRPAMEGDQEATSLATLRGSFGVCAIGLPLRFHGGAPSKALMVRYEIDAASQQGLRPKALSRGVLLAIPSPLAGTAGVVHLALGALP